MESACRLCLDPFAENASSIEEPQLKAQMEQVFNFPVELKEGYPSQVCQSCSYTISEFCVYSEKVRLNQDRLLTSVAGEKESLEKVKFEQPETIKCDVDVEEEENVVPKEEEPSEGDEDGGEAFSEGEVFAETYEPPVSRSRRRAVVRKTRKKRSRKSSEDTEDEDDDDGDESEETGKKRRKHKTREEREEELRQIHEFYKIACDLCQLTTEDISALNQHFKEAHGQDGYLVCCNKKLYTPKVMLNHIDYHRNPEEYQCKICNKNYKSKDYLANHMIKKHNDGGDDDRPFKCYQCNQSFRKENQLASHKLLHERVQCTICDKEFANKFTLKAHIVNMHSDVDRRMICDTCGQEFLNKFCFERHVKEHAGIEVLKRYQCHICNAWIRGERGLHQHMINLHDNTGKQYICNICGKQSPNYRSLAKHKRVVHCEEKFECEFCGAKFKQAVNLKEHRTIHTGEVLYSCEHCGVTKNSRSNLYVHIKNVHPVEWAAKKRQAEEAKIPKNQA